MAHFLDMETCRPQHERFRQALRRPPPDLLQSRDNFPTFDDAFAAGADKTSSSGSQSSSLNLSIGTQAALNSHSRHVAKFGIDGDQEGTASISTPAMMATTLLHEPLNLDEEHWECILEGDLSSVNTSLLNDSTYRYSPRSDRSDNRTASNSSVHSRVNTLLLTPERIRHAIIHGLTVRGQEYDNDDSDTASNSYHSRLRDAATKYNESSAACSPPSSDIDISRISALDVSRISHEGSNNSPDGSFVDERSLLPQSMTRVAAHSFPPTSTLSTSFRRGNNLSLTCLVLYDGKENDAMNQDFSANLDVMSLSPLSPARPSTMSDRSAMQFPTKHAGRELHSQEWPEASRSNFRLYGTLPRDGDLPTTNSLILSSSTQSDLSAISHQSSSEKKTLASSFISSRLAGEDCMRVRTVVPHRVFLEDPNDFPEHHDSFSAPRRNAQSMRLEEHEDDDRCT